MAKYRKRPVVIEATQWYPGIEIDGVETECRRGCFSDPRVAHVHILEGCLLVSIGDWIITGTQGEKYPCKPSIFEEIYEQA